RVEADDPQWLSGSCHPAARRYRVAIVGGEDGRGGVGAGHQPPHLSIRLGVVDRKGDDLGSIPWTFAFLLTSEKTPLSFLARARAVRESQKCDAFVTFAHQSATRVAGASGVVHRDGGRLGFGEAAGHGDYGELAAQLSEELVVSGGRDDDEP